MSNFMKTYSSFIPVLILSLSIGFQSCKDDKDDDTPTPPAQMEISGSGNWPQPVYDFANNEVTNERFS